MSDLWSRDKPFMIRAVTHYGTILPLMLFSESASRLPAGAFDFPVAGFADGSLTLWLPRPTLGIPREWPLPLRKLKSRMMHFMAVAVGFTTAEAATRIGSADVVDQDFSAFVAGVIRLNYQANDEQLAWLLQGDAWTRGMILYVWGGEERLKELDDYCHELLPHLRLLLAQGGVKTAGPVS